MAYIINRFDGTQLTIVDDGVLDNSTPLSLVGRNYTGYGESQNENFIFLLENFANISPPARPLTGQAWYDKNARAVKVYNGTAWLSIGNSTVSETEPAHSNGGLWLKVATQQLFVSDGIVWRLVGPEAVEGFAVTKMTSVKVKSTTGQFYPVILTEVNGAITAVQSDYEFTLDSTENIPEFTKIYPGLNYPTTKYAVTGNLRGLADSATRFETARKINEVSFNGTSDITIKSSTTYPIVPGEYILGQTFDGGIAQTWDIDATPQNLVGKVVARDSTGGFSATIITADLFGNITGSVTDLGGISRFNTINVSRIIGDTFSGLSARATKLETPRLINTIPFDGTADITLPVPANTLTTDTLAVNVVNSSLVNLGKLEFLEVEAPGIKVGDGNNLNIFIEGFTPTLESDVSNAIKLKLATGNASLAPTTITFVSSLTASQNGGLAPALVPDFTLSTSEDLRPSLGLPSYRWSNIHAKKVTADTVQLTTLTGKGPVDQITVSNNLIVTGATYSTLYGNVNGNVNGNVTGNVTGAASLNLLKTGDTMTGDLSWSTSGRGLSWSMNTDTASIKYYNTVDGSTDNRLEFNTSDNGDEYFRWTHSPSGGSLFESMRLTPNTSGLANLRVTGQITVTAGISAATYIGDANQLTNLNASQLLTGTVPAARLSGAYNINVTGNVTGNLQGTVTGNVIGNVSGSSNTTLIHSVTDSRSSVTTPQTIDRGVVFDFKSNSTDGLSDGGTYFGEMTFRKYGSSVDWTGGLAHQLGFTDNGNIWQRSGANTSWGAWKKLLDSSNFNSYSPTLTGTGASGTWNINITGNATTVTSVPWASVTNKPSTIVYNDGSTYGINISGNSASASILANGTTDPYYLRFRGYVTGDAGADSITGMGTYGINMSGYTDTVVHFGTGGGSSPSIQLRANYGDSLWFRVGRDSETQWDGVGSRDKLILHSGNYNSYSPTLTGGNASGTWPINISGTAAAASSVAWNNVSSKPGIAYNDGGTYSINVTGNSGTATSARLVQAPDGTRNPNDILPYSSGHAVRFDFSNAGYVGTGGNYAGIMTYVPWDGTTSSTGDASYQLAFGSTAANSGGTPQLRIRKGIDSTWNSWYDLLTSANYNNYSPTLTGGNASGTWGINVTGNAGTVSSISGAQVTAALGYTPANGSGAGSINGTQNFQDYTLLRPALQDYSLVTNALGNVAGATSINQEAGNFVSATAAGAVTWSFTNPPTGSRAGGFILTLRNGGSYTQYWPGTVRWPAGSAPALATSGVDVLVFITDDGGANWRGAITMSDSR